MASKSKQAQIEQAKDLYKAGKTLDQIAKKLGCARSTVAKLLRLHKVPIRARGPKKKVIDAEEVVAHYEKGYTIQETAFRFSIAIERASKILQQHGVVRDRSSWFPVVLKFETEEARRGFERALLLLQDDFCVEIDELADQGEAVEGFRLGSWNHHTMITSGNSPSSKD